MFYCFSKRIRCFALSSEIIKIKDEPAPMKMLLVSSLEFFACIQTLFDFSNLSGIPYSLDFVDLPLMKYTLFTSLDEINVIFIPNLQIQALKYL